MQDILIFVTTFGAALLSSMSGGGTGIIIFPVFLSMGMSYPLVSAISQVNSAFWVLPASRNYLKGRVVDWRFIISFSLVGLIGCYFGVLLITSINQQILSRCVGAVILLLVLYTYLQKGLGLNETKIYSKKRQLLAYPSALVLGFYETIFGSGNGIICTMVTFYTKGFDFISGLGHYYAISFVWALFSAVLLIRKGYFDFRIMTIAAVGAVLGAYIGSRYAKNKGNKFIKMLFVIIGGILGLKLLLGV